MNEDTVTVIPDDLNAFNDLFYNNIEKVEEESEQQETETDIGDVDTAVDAVNTEAEETAEADSPDEGEESEELSEKPKKVNRYQERINELVAKAREAERREAEAKRLLDEIVSKQTKSETETKKAETADTSANLPDPYARNEDGSDKYPLAEFDPSYIRDLNRAIFEEERKNLLEEQTREAEARKNAEARQALDTSWSNKLSSAVEQHEDFLDKTLQLETTFEGLDKEYSEYLVTTIKSLEYGPEVLYYFANNLDVAQDFVNKGPLEATLALGEINALFKSSTKKETKVSKAPPPPQMNVRGSGVGKTISLDTDNLDAFSELFYNKKKK